MAKGTRHKKVALVLLSNLVVLVLALILVEGVLRLFNIPFQEKWVPTENAVAQFDDELGWAYIPNISKTIAYGSNSKEYHFDGDGIRVPSPRFQLDHQRPSILFVGGSYTMGHGLSYKESFVNQFGALSGIPYQMVNLGVQAYGTDQALLALKRHLHKFNPKIVVYTFIKSHLRRNGNYDRRLLFPDAKFLGTKPLFALDRNDELYLARKPVLYENYSHSYLFDLLSISVGRPLGLFPPKPKRLTKAIIEEMSKYCIENGADFVMINWRTRESGYTEFEDLNVEIVDVLKNAPANWDDLTIPGDEHPNPEASHHVAMLLFDYLRTKNLLSITAPLVSECFHRSHKIWHTTVASSGN